MENDELSAIVVKLKSHLNEDGEESDNCSLNDEEMTALLNKLKSKSQQMTVALLSETKVGILVNKLRKTTSNADLINLCKSLLRNWQKSIATAGKTEKTKKDAEVSAAKAQKNSLDKVKTTTQSCEKKDSSTSSVETDSPALACKPWENSFVDMFECLDRVRAGYVRLIQKALNKGCSLAEQSNKYLDFAMPLEEEIYKLCNCNVSDSRYKSTVMSKCFNIKDKRNDLRKRFLKRQVSAQQLARMTPEEMATREMKQMKDSIKREALDSHKITALEGTKTDLFTCGRCKKKNCTYTQAQTRSSDEPMTTFVVCMECGNRWKFC